MSIAFWINAIGFQLTWWACVWGAARGWPGLGPLAAGLLWAVHLAGAQRPGLELRLQLVAVLLGFAFETAFLQSGRIQFEAAWLAGWPPVWMLALWLAFATTLNRSLRWLRTRPVLAAGLGGVGGLLSYLAGEHMGAATLLGGLSTLVLIGLGWAVLTPLLCRLALHWDGVGK